MKNKIIFGSEVGINKPDLGIESFYMNLTTGSPVMHTCYIDFVNYKNSTRHKHLVDINSLVMSGAINLDRLYEILSKL